MSFLLAFSDQAIALLICLMMWLEPPLSRFVVIFFSTTAVLLSASALMLVVRP